MYKEKKIPVCFAFDENYAQHTGVAIFSLLTNASSPSKIIFYLVGKDLSFKSKITIERMIKSFGANLKFIPPSEDFKNLKSCRHIGMTTYQRLILPEVLNEKKIIYLDGDMIVEGDISEIYQTNIKNSLLAAVPDSIESENKRCSELQIPWNRGYFNSGAMVINCDKWKNLDVTKKVIDYLKNNPDKLVAPEQDALNALFYDRWIKLPLEWNCYRDSIIRAKKEGYKKRNIKKLKKPKIIHYVSSSKPWHYSDIHPLKKRYWFYLKQSPWKEFRYQDKTFGNFFYKIYRYVATFSPKKVNKIIKKSMKNIGIYRIFLFN